ncbi:MAG: hypothetical protein M1816_004797 [Peltula sp. TS41687]|nr:MAG: hypothetical protein M1816_004797 [Peltula sp. TS41687]
MFRLASLGFSVVKKKLDGEHQVFPHSLKQLIKLDEEEWGSFYYRKALEPLTRYSLLQEVEGEWPGVTMHSLVQWRAMKYKEGDTWSFWCLMFILAASYQISMEEARPKFRRYMVTHLPDRKRLSQSHLDDMQLDDKKKTFVWNTIGKVYYKDGRWKEAEKLFVQVMETRRRVLGQEHPDTLTSIANLASTYRNQGRWKEAKELFVQVMETRKRVLGQEHPDTLTSIANLAVLGQQHPDTLTSMANPASTYRNQGRWKEAEELQAKELETCSRVLGQQHLDTLTSMANLASIFRNQGRWKKAEELDVQVMETRKWVLGQEHLNTLTSMVNLASTYRNQGRWKEAEELFVQVMETGKRVLGQEYANTLTSMANLASEWKRQGRIDEAMVLMEQCLELREKVMGMNHPGIKGTLEVLNEWKAESASIHYLKSA